MHGRDEIVVFLPVLIVHERFTSGFEDIFFREFSLTLEDTRRLEEIQGVAKVASSELGDEFE
jgi:hypothetical protein